jgi:hypothetical protein
MRWFGIECPLVLALMLAGCSGDAVENVEVAAERPLADALAARVAQAADAPALISGRQPHPDRAHTASRTISRDYDADGIDDYRVVITETFDSEGNLVSRTKDQDFEADGIIDSHVTTILAGGA